MPTVMIIPQARWCSKQLSRSISEAIKYCSLQGVGSYSAQKGPTDAIGTTTVTFDGVVAGSEIRVFLSDGTEQAGVESCDTNHTLTWPVYAIGEANNNVTIRIINVAYRIKEFAYTTKAGTQSIPVQMEADKWYNNP